MNTLDRILSDGYVHPDDNKELYQDIEDAKKEYETLLPGTRIRKDARNRINAMIDEYNERVDYDYFSIDYVI